MSIDKTIGKIGNPEKTISDDSEYIQYAVNIECALRKLMAELKGSCDPPKNAACILEAATEFYCADWSGVIDVDAEVGVWSPVLWHNGEIDDFDSESICELESKYCYDRWLRTMDGQQPLVIPDVEKIKDMTSEEYEIYNKLNIHSLIAIPLKRGSTSFFVLRNPKRYVAHSSMMEILNFVLEGILRQYHLIEAEKHILSSPQIRKSTDVFINVFGQLKITTLKGTIQESELKSTKISKFLVYMLLSKKMAISTREFTDVLWPNEDIDVPGKYLKGLVYRLQQSFSLISDYRLIEFTNYGYRFNPSLNIISDFQIFLNKCEMAFAEDSADRKENLLKTAIELYSGDILCSASSEHWLFPIATNYQNYYIGMLNELMKLFDEQHKYLDIHSYASKAITVAPHNPDVYYWLIYSIQKRGNVEMARSVFRTAEIKLIPEDFQDLRIRLNKKLNMR